MWIDGVALVVCGVPAAIQQHRYSPILKNAHAHTHVDWYRLGIVVFMLVAAMTTNIVVNTHFPARAEDFPFLGAAVWVAPMLTIKVRPHDWELLPETAKGALFVLCASVMPVEHLPLASWQTTLGLGFVSALFDNIVARFPPAPAA